MRWSLVLFCAAILGRSAFFQSDVPLPIPDWLAAVGVGLGFASPVADVGKGFAVRTFQRGFAQQTLKFSRSVNKTSHGTIEDPMNAAWTLVSIL